MKSADFQNIACDSHLTVAGGHFCAPPATQNGDWCVPVPQVAKVFAHLQRHGLPPAAPRPPTCHANKPGKKINLADSGDVGIFGSAFSDFS
jgi:hypothetical protein